MTNEEFIEEINKNPILDNDFVTSKGLDIINHYLKYHTNTIVTWENNSNELKSFECWVNPVSNLNELNLCKIALVGIINQFKTL